MPDNKAILVNACIDVDVPSDEIVIENYKDFDIHKALFEAGVIKVAHRMISNSEETWLVCKLAL